jgi:2-polyprenyl-6-hydroxyphenyl methylase/3-demethylubiquinone-9 3-methyltransferase
LTDAVQFHDQLASSWERGYESEVFALRLRVLDQLLADRNLAGQHWLDAGCGTGTLSRWLALKKGCSVVGVDASREMLANALPANNVTFQNGDIRHLPVPDGSLDGIVCSSVLEYLETPSEALMEFRRSLKPGSLLLVSVPRRSFRARALVHAAYWLTRPLGKYSMFTFLRYSRHSFTQSSFSALLTRAGFRTVRSLPFSAITIKLPFGMVIRGSDPPLEMFLAT